ncbi:MAG: TonB family protein [Opitutales bacterium]|jgi:TonB family protein
MKKNRADTPNAFRLSLLLHGGVAGIVVLWLLLSVAFRKPVEQPYVMELSGGPASAAAQPPSVAQAQSQKQPVLPSLPKLDKRDIDTPPKPVEKPPAPKPVEAKPKQIDYSQFAKQNKLPPKVQQQTSAPQRVVTAPTLDATAVLNDLRSNLSKEDNERVTGMSSSQQSELFDYFQHVRALIDANFRQPSGIVEDASAWVEFRIAGDGQVSGVRLISSSGNNAFDSAALAAVTALGKLSPPPGRTAYTRKIEFKTQGAAAL